MTSIFWKRGKSKRSWIAALSVMRAPRIAFPKGGALPEYGRNRRDSGQMLNTWLIINLYWFMLDCHWIPGAPVDRRTSRRQNSDCYCWSFAPNQFAFLLLSINFLVNLWHSWLLGLEPAQQYKCYRNYPSQSSREMYQPCDVDQIL